MKKKPEQLFFSLNRLWTIAQNTMTEVIRQKFFYILVIFGITVLVLSKVFIQFSSTEQIKFIKDFGLAAITMFGAMIAIVSTAQLLPMELENRTIYPILAKPVFRAEFLFGKYLGMTVLLLFTVLLMSFIFFGLLFYMESQFIQAALSASESIPGMRPEEAARQVTQQVLKQTRDPNLIKAIILVFFKVEMVSAISLLISTFATSVIFNVIASIMIYISGHLESAARESLLGGNSLLDTGQAFFSKITLWIITFFVPDLNAFNKADDLVVGKIIPWDYVFHTIGYGLFYSAGVLLIAYFIFEEKEI